MRQIEWVLALVVAVVLAACGQAVESPNGASSSRLLDGDPDGDGVVDIADNCPLEPNATQANRDGDEYGDPCDPCPTTVLNGEGCPQDDDGDRIANTADNCPNVVNVEQEDADSDGRGDACDACPRDSRDDIDRDGVCADVDSCPEVGNSYQADGDLDGIGDACDEDDDGDGTSDPVDRCPHTAAGAVANAEGCSLADSCPCAGPWQNPAAFAACVSKTTHALVAARLMGPAQRVEAMAAGALSTCGRPPRRERQ